MELSLSRRPVGRWLFGKLPSLGDFVSRGLDLAQRDAIDQWLTHEMASAKEYYSLDFEERYDTAPAWNFVDCDPEGLWSGGALCASTDRAGRRYPLMLAAPAEGPMEAADTSGACLEALYGAFAAGWDADQLHASQLNPVELPWEPQAPEWLLIGEEGPGIRLEGRFPDGIVRAMTGAYD
jgi:type VI secretion system protein ImpM